MDISFKVRTYKFIRRYDADTHDHCYSVPAGAVAVLALVLTLPSNFPHHGQVLAEKPKMWHIFSWNTLQKVDFLGSFLLLLATIFVVAALEEAGTTFPWKSAFVITLLAISGVLWIIFLAWERIVTRAAGLREPVFPWRFIQSRVWIGMMLYVSPLFQSSVSQCLNPM